MPITEGWNYLPIIVSAIVAFIVSFVWWGPLFGKSWIRLSGLTKEDMKKGKKGMGKKMIIALIANFIMAHILAGLLSLTATVGLSAAVMLGFWVWLGFVATIMVGEVLWKGKSWSLFWLNSVGWLVTIVIMAAILGSWA